MKKKTLLSSILVIVLCISIIAGSTFALFTTEDKVNVAVNSANVDVTANLVDGSLKTWSLYEDYEDDTVARDGAFYNGGFAKIVDEANVQIDLMTPGDLVKFTIDVTNTSNVDVNYRVRMLSNTFGNADDLTPALVVAAFIDHDADPTTPNKRFDIGGDDAANATLWQFVEQDAKIGDIYVYVAFPNTDESISPDNADNKYQNCNASLTFTIEAVQANGRVYDYAVDSAEAMLANGNDEITEGIYNGNGATIASDGGMSVAGNVTLANMTVNAANATGNNLFYLYNIDDNASLTLDNGATLNATAGKRAIFVLNRNNPVTLERGSKITASGRNAYGIFVQESSTDIILNDVGLIEVSNGAIGIQVVGGGQTVNIKLLNDAAYNYYKDMVRVDSGATVNFYVDGVIVDTING